ncbi:MAG: hypothetical protein Q9209_007512 [Squamulea sp. 1 TL-2023]
MVERPRKAQVPAEYCVSTVDKLEESEHLDDAGILEPKPLVTALASDNANTDLVELHLPDEFTTFEKILAEIQEPAGQFNVIQSDIKSMKYAEQPGNSKELWRDIVSMAGYGVVQIGRMGYQVKEADYPALAKKVTKWVADHPYHAAFQLGMGVLTLGPGLLATPALSAVGFGNQIAAGSVATVQHAAIGNVVARSSFATLQSAGAGGYGLPIVHGVIRVGTAASSGLGLIAITLDKGKPPTIEDIPSADSSVKTRDGQFNQAPEREKRSGEIVHSEAELSSLLSLSTANQTPLITLWTASWCPSCRTIRPFLTDLIEREALGENHGGVGYAEVEMDSPDIGALAGNKYFITSIPTLLAFRVGEAALDTKVTSVDEMKDKEFMKLWIEGEATRGGERGGGGGVTTGFLGALFGMREK